MKAKISENVGTEAWGSEATGINSHKIKYEYRKFLNNLGIVNKFCRSACAPPATAQILSCGSMNHWDLLEPVTKT